MRSKLSRLLVLATVAAALLMTPIPASAAPWGGAFGSVLESSWGAITGWAGGLLQLLWAEEGGSFDPLGRPIPGAAAADDGGRV